MARKSKRDIEIDGKVIANNIPLLIDGYWVDKKSNTDRTAIEVGDQIMGNFAASRFIIADVDALPHTTETNLSIYLDTEK